MNGKLYLMNNIMLLNYFKTAFRNFWKNKTSSAINIFGLTIGLTSCLLIALYIQHELSYDKFELKGKRIARVIMEYSFNGSSESQKGNFTSVRVAPVFTRTFPEVESAIRMVSYKRVVKYNDKLFNEKKVMFADPNFFNIFSFKLLQGDPRTAISAPHTVVLTVSTAKKYFGNENALGKTLRVGNDSSFYQVTGVMQDCLSNSQIKFDFLASFSSLGITSDHEKNYYDANYTTYLLLKDKNSITSLQAKLPAFMKREMTGQGATVNFYLEPFTKIHLYSEYRGFEPNNSITYLYILAAVALLILIIACSSYINLSTARAIERAKEVGVRKVIGADKKQLFWQFISESAIICLMAVILSVVIAIFVMPWFNQLTEKNLQLHALFSLPFILFSLFIVACVSFLAGSYPALILAGFQPVKVFKGSFKNTSSGQWLRKSLIVFQFAISVFLIVSTFIMQKQLYYIQHKKLGYDREHIVILPMDSKMLPGLSLIKQEFKSNPDIISVSRCERSPVEGGGGYNMRSAVMSDNEQIAVTANPIDEDYIKTTGLQVIAGTDLTEQDIKDASADDQNKNIYHFILNESAAKQLGWTPQEAVGKKMFLDNSRPGFVKGIVKDFHFESLHNAIRPFILFPEFSGNELLVKLSGHHLPQTISFLAAKWKILVPYRPFEYRFMDDDYNKLYSAELRLGKVMNLFATIAIVLACLGLFGLSSYSVQQRVKEIGIRKVLGASVTNITTLLSKEFIGLVFIAIMVANPVAWWIMNKWLEDFAYRININWSVFVFAGSAALIIALVTVSFQAIKAAVANPVKSLRTE
jgi:putative ABC transport system permease protein